MNRFCLLIIVISSFIGTVNAANDKGYTVLADVVKSITSAPSVSAKFTINEGGNTVNGEILASENRFRIMAANGQYESWYDGKTQWTWTTMTNEVNMTSPSREELMESNPFSILESASENYSATVVNDSADTIVLKLVPKKTLGNNVKEASLKVVKSTNLPSLLTVYLLDGNIVTFTFSDIQRGGSVPLKEFQYNPALHPGSEIIDLR